MIALQKRVLRPGEKIKVMVVDDSVVIRRLITTALEEESAIQVVGVAANGLIALERIPQFNPDAITLDVEMPEMDGLETLRRIRSQYPHIRVIMFSTLTERGAAVTLDALQAGADDYVPKVSNEGSLDRSLLRLRQELVPRIKQFYSLPAKGPAPLVLAKHFAPSSCLPASSLRPEAVVIGVSTGGPNALSVFLPELPASFPLPVLVVQHMPPLFTRFLADRLNSCCQLPVAEAAHGDPVGPGKILIAPGGLHMKIAGSRNAMRIALDDSMPLNSCRPAVDALFSSASEVLGGTAIAVILTGMGQDGLQGVHLLKAKGAYVIAQDEASSVVWGMPGAVANAGLADRILPLNCVAEELLNRTAR